MAILRCTWLSTTIIPKNYLTERKQYVIYNETPSELGSITTGVPQGSILGPLLFIIYIHK